jgi:molybdopterin/thiamine biosynthesis adenylyltransferase
VSFTPEEVERYARHLVLHGVGGPGQAKLKGARVLVVGAGGLGAPVIQYLAAAGIGTLGIVDDDRVSLSNLQRQVIHRTEDIGRLKVERAAEAVREINPHVAVDAHATRLEAGNADDLVAAYDLVVDGSDNFATRYLVNDACFRQARPLVSGTVGTYDGYVTTFRAYETGADGVPNPSYRCLFPEPPQAGQALACEEAGILGALAGLVGSMMALEAMKEIVGTGTGLVGRLVMLDARDGRFETISYGWNPENPLNGRGHRADA